MQRQTLDTQNYCHINNPKARDKVIEIMNGIHLVDYLRVLILYNKMFTWREKKCFKQVRLDNTLISENFTNYVEDFFKLNLAIGLTILL
jgi:exonuclease III